MENKVSSPLLALFALILLTATSTLNAHNGEYIPPDSNRDPPGFPPAGATPRPNGTPLSDPSQTGRPGVVSGGSLTPGRTTAKPDAVRVEAAISWEGILMALRWGLPDGVPTVTRGLRNRARRALVLRIEDPSLEVRRYVVLSLGRLGAFDEAAGAIRRDPVLASGVGVLGPGFAVRMPAVKILGPSIRETLLPVVRDKVRGPFDRALASISLAHGGAGEATALLDTMQDTPPGPLRDVLLFSLGLTGHPGGRGLLLDRVLPPKDADADDDPALRALFVYSLSRIPGPEVTGDLHRRLIDPSTRVRAAAAICLGGRDDAVVGGRAVLRRTARQARARPRSAALLSLAISGDTKVVELSRQAMTEPACRNNGTAAVAALTLGLIGSAEDGPDLVATFVDSGAPAELRKASAVAAGLVSARDSTSAMVKGIRAAKDPMVASFGILGLSLIDGKAAFPLIRKALDVSKNDAVRRIMVIALGYAGGKEAEALLVKAFGDNYLVNREAPLALFRLNPELAIDEILKRLTDEENQWSRRFAAIALGRCFEQESPSFFGSVLLGTALCGQTPVEKLMLYLESGS